MKSRCDKIISDGLERSKFIFHVQVYLVMVLLLSCDLEKSRFI